MMKFLFKSIFLVSLTMAWVTAVPHMQAATNSLDHAPAGSHNQGQSGGLEITAKHPDEADADDHYIFKMSDHEIPSGWTSIDFRNESGSTHFGYLVRVGDEYADMTREQYLEEGSNLFQDAWDPYFAGELDVEGFFDLLIPMLPEWFEGMVSSGGPGFLGGHQSSRTMINLAPGTYFIECYVMDTEGVFHITHGMVERLVVTEEVSGASEPEADLQVSISSTDGLVFEEESVQPGLQTFAVTFEDNVYYPHGLGHDVHLIRLNHETTISQVNDWMDYMDVGADGFYADRGALVSSSAAPGPETFLGGVQSIFADADRGRSYPETGYFQALLKPGRYALVSEVPNPMQPDPERPEFSLLHEFSVTPGAGLTGAWFDPATNGQGWNLMAAPHGVFGFYYGYGDNGHPLWLMTEQAIGEIELGEPITFDLLYGSAGAFGDPVPPEGLTHWGEVTFTFDSCEEATAEVSGIDGSEIQQLQRVAETVSRPECGL